MAGMNLYLFYVFSIVCFIHDAVAFARNREEQVLLDSCTQNQVLSILIYVPISLIKSTQFPPPPKKVIQIQYRGQHPRCPRQCTNRRQPMYIPRLVTRAKDLRAGDTCAIGGHDDYPVHA